MLNIKSLLVCRGLSCGLLLALKAHFMFYVFTLFSDAFHRVSSLRSAQTLLY